MERNRSDEKSLSRRKPSGAAVPRQAITDALARAFFEKWARVGLGALSLERVAKRAGVGKAALYRRWRSKQEMAIDLVQKMGVKLNPIPDTGTLEGDLRLLLLSLRQTLRHPLIRRILPDLHAEMARSRSLNSAIRETVQIERRARVETILDRAIARGELPAHADPALAADALASLLYWRIIVTGERVDRPEIEKIVRFIASGLAE